MGLARLWGYIKAAFFGAAEKRMDPAIQIEQSIAEARRQDLELRNAAARVVAHRSEIQMKLDRAVEDSAKAKEQAGQALRNAEEATASGNASEADRWMRTAQALAMRLESSESLVESLKAQYQAAQQQAEGAKEQVNQNALRLEGLTSKRLELVGKLRQAEMQEEVNRTLEVLHRPMESSGPSFDEIEDKINRRMALASASAELESGSIRSASEDVERSVQELGAQRRLDALRAELGITPASSAGQISDGAGAPASSEEQAQRQSPA
jgi:phage shock protein A